MFSYLVVFAWPAMECSTAGRQKVFGDLCPRQPGGGRKALECHIFDAFSVTLFLHHLLPIPIRICPRTVTPMHAVLLSRFRATPVVIHLYLYLSHCDHTYCCIK